MRYANASHSENTRPSSLCLYHVRKWKPRIMVTSDRLFLRADEVRDLNDVVLGVVLIAGEVIPLVIARWVLTLSARR